MEASGYHCGFALWFLHKKGENMVYEWDARKARRARLVRTAIVCLAVTIAFLPLSYITLG